MANDYFFQHDYNPTNDPKIQAMIADYGDWGYGLFWRIIEALHRDENHRLPVKSYVFKAFAQHKSTSVEQVQAFVEDCINSYELLLTDNGLFYSPRVDRNIQKRTLISEKRSLAGKASALAKQMSTSVEQNPTKEKKEKESKGNEIKEKERADKSAAFDLFWDAYDKKDGKKNSFARWMKIPLDDMPMIIEKAKLYAVMKKGDPYKKDPLTWLNGEHWNDANLKTYNHAERAGITDYTRNGPQLENYSNQREYENALERFNAGKSWQ